MEHTDNGRSDIFIGRDKFAGSAGFFGYRAQKIFSGSAANAYGEYPMT
jgi:hypothetical protein